MQNWQELMAQPALGYTDTVTVGVQLGGGVMVTLIPVLVDVVVVVGGAVDVAEAGYT
jgi:hypothetical protein